MRTLSWLSLAVAALVSAGIAIAAQRSVPRPRSAADPAAPCCFTNERFAGVCRVVPDRRETCDAIEAYLNNPSSSGRTYCDSTALRGGWTQVDCSTGKPKETPSPTPSGSRLAPSTGAALRTAR